MPGSSNPDAAVMLEQVFAEPHGTIVGFPSEPPPWRRRLIEDALHGQVVVDGALDGPTLLPADAAATMPASMEAIDGHTLATSTDCSEPGCPKEAGTKGGPFRGLCDEHAAVKRDAMTKKRLATRAENNGHDAGAAMQNGTDGAASIEQAVKQLVPIGRELDRKLRKRDKARDDVTIAAREVRPVLEQFADALAAVRATAEEAVK